MDYLWTNVEIGEKRERERRTQRNVDEYVEHNPGVLWGGAGRKEVLRAGGRLRGWRDERGGENRIHRSSRGGGRGEGRGRDVKMCSQGGKKMK